MRKSCECMLISTLNPLRFSRLRTTPDTNISRPGGPGGREGRGTHTVRTLLIAHSGAPAPLLKRKRATRAHGGWAREDGLGTIIK